MDQLTQSEVAAMWLFGAEYAASGLSAFDFYRSLSDFKADLVSRMVSEVNNARSTSETGQAHAQMERDCAAICDLCRDGNKPVLHKSGGRSRGREYLAHCTDRQQDIWSKCLAAPIRSQWAAPRSVPVIMENEEAAGPVGGEAVKP